MAYKETLNIQSIQVVIDPSNLQFSEVTLSDYIQKEAGFYDNFGAALAMAEKNQQLKELAHDRLYSERFAEHRDNGSSEKTAEAKAKSDVDVCEARTAVIEAKYIVKRLNQHLKAWDKNHDNAQSLGHTLRRQMDKLNGDIYSRGTSYFQPGDPTLDARVSEMVPPFDPDELEADLDLT